MSIFLSQEYWDGRSSSSFFLLVGVLKCYKCRKSIQGQTEKPVREDSYVWKCQMRRLQKVQNTSARTVTKVKGQITSPTFLWVSLVSCLKAHWLQDPISCMQLHSSCSNSIFEVLKLCQFPVHSLQFTNHSCLHILDTDKGNNNNKDICLELENFLILLPCFKSLPFLWGTTVLKGSIQAITENVSVLKNHVLWDCARDFSGWGFFFLFFLSSSIIFAFLGGWGVGSYSSAVSLP